MTTPVVLPVFFGFWMRRRLVKSRLGLGSRSPFARSTELPPAVAPDPSVEAQMAALPDLFALVRVIGNDLPPRHKIGQSRENLDFVLRNEPDFDACEKLWIVNRIVDKAEEAQIVARLEQAGATFEVISFDAQEYAAVPLDYSQFSRPQVLQSDAFAALDKAMQARAVAQIYRMKNAYVMHNNGARNRAIDLGQARAKWVLPFDGNCFLTQADWDRIRADVTASPYQQYFVVPMARLGSNDRAFAEISPEDAQEEPQIVFRRDAPERFDEAHPYGRRPKVELLTRLGVPGPWEDWLMDPWDIPAGPLGSGAHRVGRAGMVRRLASGRADLEAQGQDTLRQRAMARSDAIVATLRRADGVVLAARGYAPDRPVLFDRDRLARHAGGPLGAALAEAAAGGETSDRAGRQRMSDDMIGCALAWAMHGDAAARNRARDLLRTRFRNTEMAARPRFARMRRGHRSDEGSIIRSRDLAFILDAVRLLDDRGLSEELRTLLRPYADRLATSEQGVAERRARNNRGTFFDLRSASIAAFLGDTELLLESWMYSVSRIGGQFSEDGAQPHEPTWDSRAFNLQGWLTLLAVYRGCGIPIETQPEITRIGTGVRWLLDQRGAERPGVQVKADRFAPIAVAAADLGLAAVPEPADLAQMAARPWVRSDNGVPPYWPLMFGQAVQTREIAE